MTERRMFTKKITESDAFLEMPCSSQMLYFHLSMNADDDGFVNNPRKIQRMCGATNDDFKLLVAKKFIILFESGVIVIKHWRMHNYIRSDRYSPTNYTDEKNSLKLKENKAYTLINQPMDTDGIPMVDTGKDSIGKNSINNISSAKDLRVEDKKSKNEQLEHDFELIYATYPKKRGKTVAFANYKQWVSPQGKDVGGVKYHLTNRQIYLAVQKYVEQQKDAGQDDYQYWKNFDTLMGRQLLDYVDLEDK